MNIDIIRKKNKMWVVEFYDDYGYPFRLNGEYTRKKDADYVARKLNLLFNKIK